MKKNPERPSLHPKTVGRYWSIRIWEKIAPLAEKIGFLPGNYTKFEKQVYYTQLRKKPSDNADMLQVLDLHLVICHNNDVLRQYSWKSIEGVPPFNDFW